MSIENRASVFYILKKYKLNSTKVAIELNGIIIATKSTKKKLNNDKIEVVQFIGEVNFEKDKFKIDNINLVRLIDGTGKYKNLSETAKAIKHLALI